MTIDQSRRSFLRNAPGAIAAAPLVVKQAAQRAAGMLSAGGIGSSLGYGVPVADTGYSSMQSFILGKLKDGIVPDHMKPDFEREARMASLLPDPDIEAMRLPENTKRRMQYERSYKQAIERRIVEMSAHSISEKLWQSFENGAALG